MPQLRSKHVFVNCPFDIGYKPIFDAIVFAIYDLGFVARCAREEDDGGDNRLAKINRIIDESKFGIHDLSAVELDPVTNLPRFNMPLELGLFLGCKAFGPQKQRKKASLILDRDAYRYQAFISDIAGQDIHAHNGHPPQAITEVRNWLRTAAKLPNLPGAAAVVEDYTRFCAELPEICQRLNRTREELTFLDFSETIAIWLRANR